MGFTELTRHQRKNAKGETYPVDLVRVAHDVIGFVTTNADGYVFGMVLTDPTADTGVAGAGYESIGYCFPPSSGREAMAERIADEWAKRPSLTALRGQSREGWPTVAVGGQTLISCLYCLSFNVSTTIREAAYGTGPGHTWRMGDPGGRQIAYCHDCGKASDS